ncbi:MAG TPA: hypothetical protein VMM76_23910 [Pirellulaceae bacterium]|nr:hypothetical protein [Pirellulaceae bacterium]
MADSLDSADVNARWGTIAFAINGQWSTHDMTRFCKAVGTLYAIFLVQSESAGDEDCERLLLEWDKSVDIVLAYRKSNDPDYTDGRLVIDTVNLRSRGVISLRGWSDPIDRLYKVVGEVPRHASVKAQAKAARRSVPRMKSLNEVEWARLVAIVQSCLADLDKLGARVC